MSAVTLEPDGGLGLEASARIRHRAAGRVDATVLAWCRWYTADLPDDVASERRAEVASDLYEEREHSGARATGSILGRAIRGIPADLAWRGARLRRAAMGAPRGTFPLAMPALAHLAAIALVAWGGFIVWRVVRSVLIGDWRGAADVAELSVVGLVLALVGSWLLMVARRRAFAGLVLAIAAYLLIRFGTYALMETSVSFTAYFSTSTAQMVLLNRVATGAAVLFFLSMAAWWTAPKAVAEPEPAARPEDGE
ncbi:hypothetical protein [Agromyces mariniharenae]|uniref:Uncharacterized protein n=1 Tax=Agromyces mariniharenae TaxID=2604423 RepID=A0A5S4VI22_9MICO|nr:hypothetical protein [Agromyces mariniharenae]TYL53755.1 hypothetical protein FYC51_08935 [Agromyces mariniharenae]